MAEQRTIDRYKTPLVIATLGAAMVASSPKPAAAESPLKEAHPTRIAEVEGKWKPLPPDLRNLIKEVSQDNSHNRGVLKLLGTKYRELMDFELGRSKVRIIQLGGELTGAPLSHQHLETMKSYLETYDEFSKSNAAINIPLEEVSIGLDGLPYASNHVGHYKISPVSLTKDRVIFIVPKQIFIGSNQSGQPDAFTDRISSKITSFIRTDVGGDQSIAIEACQSTVRATLADKNSTDVLASRGELNHIGQELVCNGIGQAVLRSRSGQPFDEYVKVLKHPVVARTAPPTPGHNGFAGSVPHVNNPKVYHFLSKSIPKNIGDYLTFPTFVA